MKSDAELARVLDIPASTVANWNKRGSVPVAVCTQAAAHNNLSLDWLVFGKELVAFDLDAAALATEVILEGAVFLELSDDAGKYRLLRRAFQEWYAKFARYISKLEQGRVHRDRAVERVRKLISQGVALAFLEVVEDDRPIYIDPDSDTDVGAWEPTTEAQREQATQRLAAVERSDALKGEGKSRAEAEAPSPGNQTDLIDRIIDLAETAYRPLGKDLSDEEYERLVAAIRELFDQMDDEEPEESATRAADRVA